MTEPKKILFIEDESELQKRIQMFFKAEGLELVSAYDGNSGIEMADDIIPDVILLDLILPKKNGFDVLKEIKNNPRLVNTPVIILTNLEGAQDVETALSLGASTYLVKASYSLEEILEKVKETIAKRVKK